MPRSPSVAPRLDAAARAPTVLYPTREEHLRAVRRQLGSLLAGYAVFLQVAAALERLAWQWPPHLAVAWALSPAELVATLVRGLPVGYFVAFGLRRRGALKRSAMLGGALGVSLEMCVLASGESVRPLTVGLIAASAAAG